MFYLCTILPSIYSLFTSVSTDISISVYFYRKVQLYLYLIKHHAMETYGEWGIAPPYSTSGTR
jgi:hypothetical protein